MRCNIPEKKVIIIDYGVGNFRNVQKAFQHVGANAIISEQPADIAEADAVVLPGVGAFGDAIDNVRRRNLEDPMRQAVAAGKPFFGICVGMQLLFEHSNDMGKHIGLALLPGYVTRFSEGLRVPHMGWNQIEPRTDHPLLKDIQPNEFAYFANSYYCVPQDNTFANLGCVDTA